MAQVERIQKDTTDRQNNGLQLVFLKDSSELTDERGVHSILHYWVEGMRIDLDFATAKSAMDAYKSLQNVSKVVVCVETPRHDQPQVTVSEE